MVYYQHHQSQLLQLQTVEEESETEADEMHDDARSNSSTLKCSSQHAGRTDGLRVVMTESTDSGLESDKNVDTEVSTQNDTNRPRRNENLLYHCQVGL